MKSRPWLPYVLPMAIYTVFLLFQSNANLVWLYPLKTVAVAGALAWFWRQYDELRTNPSLSAPGTGDAGSGPLSRSGQKVRMRGLSLAVAVGLVAIAVWIVIDPLYPKLSEAAPLDASGRYGFIVFRVIGAVLVVPVMEELFWRAFLIRWLVHPDFKRVSVGTFTWPSFLITVALFGAEHREWLAGLICGALYNWLLYRTRSVVACVIAHAASNAALAAWVLARGDWRFW